MVVTRRPPAPVPTSRTPSSQPIPRVKSKGPQDSTHPPAPSPLSNSVTTGDSNSKSADDQPKSDLEVDSAPKKGKQKNKAKQKKVDKKVRRKSTFVDLLIRGFLLWLTIYTIFVCPTDEKLQSPVCRRLHYYRKLVVEPLVLSPIKRVLSHPSVTPYVDRATPYATRLISATKPIALRTQKEWNSRVVLQWNKRVVPMWNAHIVPQWDRYAAPHITRIAQHIEPYRTKVVQEYERRLRPHLRVASYNLLKWQRQVQPYIILAANKIHDGYEKSKPYAIPVLQRLRVPFARLAHFLVAQRRQFVDPHVKKIWDRVIELSGGKSRPVTDIHDDTTRPVQVTSRTSSTGQPTSQSSSSREEFDTVPGSGPSVLPVVISELESLPLAATTISPTDTASPASHSSVTNDDSAGTTPPPAENIAFAPPLTVSEGDNTPISLDSFSAQPSPLHSVPASIVPLTDPSASEPITNTVSGLPPATSPSLTHVAPGSAPDSEAASGMPVGSEVSSAPAHPSIKVSSSSEGDDVDLDTFWAELGLGDDLLSESTSESEEVAPPVPTESEEEKAERLRLRKEETARKRTDITGRHTRWEEQVEERIIQNRKLLRQALVTIRKAAVVELKGSVEMRKEVEGLVEEAEKYLKGAEKYLANLKRESRTEEDKRAMWERVMLKVDSKFGEHLSQTEAVVNGWYNQILNKEIGEVRRLSDEVKDIADRGQADIGLDYAWLDDVTYNDWQRYHDLVRRSDNFTAEAFSIQNGSDFSPPFNPVLPALEDLQSEVQDVVIGFETRLRGIKRKGERAFDTAHGDSSSDVTEETVLQEGQEEQSDKEPVANIQHVVIGRSKEEVMEALNRVADQEGHATSDPTSSSSNAEQIMENIVHQVEEQVSSSLGVSHEEL